MSVQPEAAAFMTAKFPETDVTPFDLLMIGQSLLNWAATTVTMGHARPGNTLDYIGPRNDVWGGVIRDFVVWTSGRNTFNPGAQRRLSDYIFESGWQRHMLSEAAKIIMPTEKPGRSA